MLMDRNDSVLLLLAGDRSSGVEKSFPAAQMEKGDHRVTQKEGRKEGRKEGGNKGGDE